VQSTFLRIAAAFRKLKLLPFRIFTLRLVSGFRRLGFLVVIRILSGKVRCAYRYENGWKQTAGSARSDQKSIDRASSGRLEAYE